MQGSVWKIAIFYQYLALSRKWYKIEIYLQSYNGRAIESRICSIEWRHFQWPWVSFEWLSEIFNNTKHQSRTICDSWASGYILAVGPTADRTVITTYRTTEWHTDRQNHICQVKIQKQYRPPDITGTGKKEIKMQASRINISTAVVETRW